jgi:hypothetical protein
MHVEVNFHTQSVMSTRSVMLKRTTVNTTLTTEISTRTRVISTRRLWCWHVWVWLWHSQKWLWHSYVLKPHSACRNHFFLWWTQSEISTRTSVIYIYRVRFPHAECDFYTQCDVLKRKNVNTTLTTEISTRTRVISARRVWWWHVWVWLWHSRKWLWHSYVLKPQSACRNHSCVWCSNAYCDEHTHEFQLDTCDFKTNQLKWT